MEEGLGTELENVFPDDGGAQNPAPETPPPAYSEWSGAGTGGGDDGDYNLEAFVSAEMTLADSSRRADGAGDRRSGAAA